jgi:hypothetical protein
MTSAALRMTSAALRMTSAALRMTSAALSMTSNDPGAGYPVGTTLNAQPDDPQPEPNP